MRAGRWLSTGCTLASARARCGTTTILWQSKEHGAYAIALADGGKRLLVGTGPQGRVYDVDALGNWSPLRFAKGIGIAMILAIVASRLSLFWGNGMSKVKR